MQDNTLDTTPMDKVAVAKYLNCSVPQILNLVARGHIPEGQYIGGRKKYWFKAHLDEYKARIMAKAAQTWSRPNNNTQPQPTVATTHRAAAKPPKTELKAVPDTQTSTSMSSKRQLEAHDDRNRRQKQHIQESCQAEISYEDATHMKSILTDLSALLKSRKAGA